MGNVFLIHHALNVCNSQHFRHSGQEHMLSSTLPPNAHSRFITQWYKPVLLLIKEPFRHASPRGREAPRENREILCTDTAVSLVRVPIPLLKSSLYHGAGD